MIPGSPIWWAFVAISVGLFLLSLPILGRAYRRHRDTPEQRNSEHGLVVATTFSAIAFGLVLTSAGQAVGSSDLTTIGAATIRGPLLVCLLYLLLIRPDRALRTRAGDYRGEGDH